jgi:Zn-dependent protease with chaperone function
MSTAKSIAPDVYRNPDESPILVGTLLLVLGVIALTATATVCTSVIFVLGFVIISYQASLSHHQQLLRSAQKVGPLETERLAEVVAAAAERLQPGPIEVYLLPTPQLNAYTFGLASPKVIVLYTGLLRIMDEDEIKFILGHEMGHVALGHTWLNSLIGGIAGIPSPFSAAAVMALAFRSWNRACEYSADRAGLIACGKLEKAISALVKLVAGPQADDQGDLEQAYQKIDAEDDTIWGELSETMASHPLMIRRIERLRQFARSRGYQNLFSG